MKKLGVVLGAWVVLMLVAAHGTPQTSAPVDPDGPMPVAEFNAAPPADPAEAAIRAARNQRFSLYGGGPITDDSWGVDIFIHPRRRSEKDLVQEADAIIEATVLTAAAYVTQNRQVVYSEFRVRVAGTLKDRALSRAQPALATGDVITSLREGGAVQLPNGRVVKQHWDAQHLPVIGETYMLFLRREPAIAAFTIITGYAIKESEVQSLDDVYYFPRHTGTALDEFRQQIRTLLEQSGS